MMNGKRIIVFLPAFNTALPLAMTLKAIPRPPVDEMIVVDDGSKDATAQVGRELGATVVSHMVNSGYGAAQKTGFAECLKRNADVIVMVHSDFQYDPRLVPEIIADIVEGRADACFGSRMHRKGDARKGGMPWWRFIANVCLTFIEDSVLQLGLSEYHTGYRAYSRSVLERIPYLLNSDNYVFDTEMIAELRAGNFRVAEIGIPTRYAEESCSPTFWKSVRYGFSTLGVLWSYILHQTGMAKSAKFEIRDQVHASIQSTKPAEVATVR
ncbi:glycosyltransferase family 2 protein [Candidatus Uhrbacteria bacterium]|nr:glycosyltransferase family 2 protein [Candidatus Uhrbacteria bacterium]